MFTNMQIKPHWYIMSGDLISAEWILYTPSHLAGLTDGIIEWGTVMKRKRWQHGRQPKHLPFRGLPLLFASEGITLPLSRYQRDFTPYQAQATHDHTIVDLLISSADDVNLGMTRQLNALRWSLPHWRGRVRLGAACRSITVCRAEPSSNMRIIHLASLCVKIPTCPGFLLLRARRLV